MSYELSNPRLHVNIKFSNVTLLLFIDPSSNIKISIRLPSPHFPSASFNFNF